MLCDNSSRMGTGVSLNPQCYDGKREYECEVKYDEYGIDSDTMVLCSKCRDNLKKSAKRYGYHFKSKRVV